MRGLKNGCRTSSSSPEPILGVDPIHEPMPIQPTAHYAMGGYPPTVDGRILRDASGTVVPGLYSAGESACVSVHGANRLGTNSLVDLVVYGRRAGKAMAEYARQSEFRHTPPHSEAAAKAAIDGLLSRPRDRALGQDPRRDAEHDDGQLRRVPHRRDPDPSPRRYRRP